MPCYFCLEDRPLTYEHVLSEHFIDLFPDLSGGVWHGRVRGPAEALTGSGPRWAKRFGDKFKTVCRPCNNEWMNRLDHEAKPLIRNLMAQTDPLTISAADQALLARWATKVALVMFSAHPRPSVSEARRLDFFKSQSPPRGTDVFLLQIDSAKTDGAWVTHNHHAIGFADAHLRMGGVAFYTRFSDVPGHRPNARTPEDFNPFPQQLWPSEFKPLPWPFPIPSRFTDVDHHRRFCDRLRPPRG